MARCQSAVMNSEPRLAEWLEQVRNTAQSVSGPDCRLRSPRPGEPSDQFLRRSEIAARKQVDNLLIEWLDTGASPPMPPGDATFWFRARLEHAFWLAKLVSSPQDHQAFFQLEDEQGKLTADTMCWLLFDSWKFAGVDFWVYLTSEVLALTHFDFGAD